MKKLLPLSMLLALSSFSNIALYANEVSRIVKPKSDYYVNLFIARSPNVLNWKSPSTLARTLLTNSISGMVGERNITLGHVNLEVVCNGRTTNMGMHYREKKEGIKLIFKDKVGLGLVFYNMVGRYDTKEDIDIAKKDFYNGKTSIITMVVDQQKCERLEQYGKNFKTSGEQYKYGLNNNPFNTNSKLADPNLVAKFTQNGDEMPFGAGCSAFIVSAMQELDIDHMLTFEKWYAKVKVPQALIGQYSDQIYYTADEMKEYKAMNINPGKEVSIFKVIAKGKRWATASEAGKEIVYYSPNKIYDWVETESESLKVGDNSLGGTIQKIIMSSKKRKRQAYQMIINY